MTQQNFDRAIRATKVGLHVFPWKFVERDGKTAKVPVTDNGHLAATLDPEQIATWFLEQYASPEIQIGVHCGASGLIAADLDRKNGKNGFEATGGWVDFPATWKQTTPTGGEHLVYLAPANMQLAPSADFNNFEGLDVRAGSSWIGLYDDPPVSRDEFANAPEWLLDEKPARTLGASYDGQLPEWVTMVGAQDEPSNKVLDLITRIPDNDISHSQMVEFQYNAIRLASEGQPGTAHALQLLRDAWLDRDPALHSTPQSMWAWKFDEALASGVRKAGALEARIASLPDWRELLENSDAEVFGALVGESQGNAKAEWFKAANMCIRYGYTDDEVLALLWNTGLTKNLSHDWGFEFCAERISEQRTKVDEQQAIVERETPRQPVEVDAPPVNPASISLLSDEERHFLAKSGNFIHRYTAHAHHRFDMANTPYHAANAWSVLSLVYGQCGFVPMQGKTMGLNLFQMSPGDSSTGKSDSLIMRRDILRQFFKEDQRFNLSTEVSPEVLHEDLLMREGKPAFFNTDEASGFFAKMAQKNGYTAGIEDKITDWYGGWVEPVGKRVSKATLGESNKGGPCYFVSHFFATPDRLFENLTRDQFLSGFLARFLWSFGNGAVDDESRFEETQADAREEKAVDDWVAEVVAEFRLNIEHVGARRAVKADEQGLRRLSENRKRMERIVREKSDWKVTESAYRRLCDSLRKCAALLALSRGSTRIELVDVLGTIEQAETWVAGLLEASKRVSSSVFEREAREIAYAVRTMSASNGFVTAVRLRNKFSRYTPRDFQERVDWGVQTGLIALDASNREHKDRWSWKGDDDD